MPRLRFYWGFAGVLPRFRLAVRVPWQPESGTCRGSGTRTIASITQSDIQDLVTAWCDIYAPSTVVRMYRTVQAIFSYAVDNGFRGRTPCRRIELPDLKPRESQILERAEVERLAQALGAYGPMVYLAVMGPRWGEIAGLQVGHVRFSDDDPSISIETQRSRGKNGQMVTTTTKSRNSKRPLTIPAWLGDMLFTHLSDRGGVSDEDYVFVCPRHPAALQQLEKTLLAPGGREGRVRRICPFTTCAMWRPIASMKRA